MISETMHLMPEHGLMSVSRSRCVHESECDNDRFYPTQPPILFLHIILIHTILVPNMAFVICTLSFFSRTQIIVVKLSVCIIILLVVTQQETKITLYTNVCTK